MQKSFPIYLFLKGKLYRSKIPKKCFRLPRWILIIMSFVEGKNKHSLSKRNYIDLHVLGNFERDILRLLTEIPCILPYSRHSRLIAYCRPRSLMQFGIKAIRQVYYYTIGKNIVSEANKNEYFILPDVFKKRLALP